MIDLLFSDGHLVVGVEDDSDGSLRVYLDARHSGLHTHIDDPGAQQEVRDAWAGATGHLTTRVPNDALCVECDGEATA